MTTTTTSAATRTPGSIDPDPTRKFAGVNPVGAVTHERPRTGVHGQAQCAADQDAVSYGQRPGDGQELIPRRAGHSGLSGGRRSVSGRSAADVRLRFAGGVLVPFLPCRW